MMYSTSVTGSTLAFRPLRGLCLLVLTVCLLILSGCSHQTTISEATTHLQAQALEIELNSYKNQLQVTKKSLTSVLPSLQVTSGSPPESKFAELSHFLENNDCLKSATKEQREYCYKLTRYRLIQVTEMLDASTSENWAAKLTIKQLVDNINVIIESLDSRANAVQPPTATVK